MLGGKVELQIDLLQHNSHASGAIYFPAEAGLQMVLPECGSPLSVCASMLRPLNISSIDVSEIQAKSS